jgi:hypothetical protein
MTKIKASKVYNEVTQTEELLVENCTLGRVGDTVLENTNGTNYQIAEVELPNGAKRSAQIYSKTLDYVSPGDKINLRIIANEDGQPPLVIVALAGSTRISASELKSMFEVEMDTVAAEPAVNN